MVEHAADYEWRGEGEEAADLLAVLQVYTLRRALGDNVGALSLRAARRIGGVEVRGGSPVHRRELASAGEGEVLVSGGSVVAGTGKMSGSGPRSEHRRTTAVFPGRGHVGAMGGPRAAGR